MTKYEISLFFLRYTPTPETTTLPLHAALPIFVAALAAALDHVPYIGAASRRVERSISRAGVAIRRPRRAPPDRKSTRLNSSHANISYAVFCLKKKQLYYTSFLLLSPSPQTFSH